MFKEVSVEGIVAVGLIGIAVLTILTLGISGKDIVIAISGGLIGFLTKKAVVTLAPSKPPE